MSIPRDPDELRKLREFATPREKDVLAHLAASGSCASAGRALGMTRQGASDLMRRLVRRAATRGHSPAHDMTHLVPDGYHVKGTSTYYDKEGKPRGQWVKSQKDRDDQLKALAEAVTVLAEPFKRVRAPIPRADKHDKDLLCVYPMGDPHLGMFAWARETGQNFDLRTASRNLLAATEHLVNLAPPAKEGLLINLGDFFHRDNNSGVTSRGKNPLDGDSRWAKVLEVGVRTMRHAIDCALTKHEKVTVINEIGNHDDHSAIMLSLCLREAYEREPRVTIDTSPAKFHWFKFGNTLIGVTHGDTVKPADLPGIMATDCRKDWGRTEHHHWYTGHVHHDGLKEYPGCIVEHMRTLAPADAWHRGQGYRSGQDMKCDVFHRRWGRINRHQVGIQQIWHELKQSRGTRGARRARA